MSNSILNLLWFFCGGFILGLGWLIIGTVWCISIVGVPVGLQCYRMAVVIMAPFGRTIDKYSPEILIGCGLVGFATTVVLVAKEAPIAKEKVDDLHKELGGIDEEITKTKVIFEEVKTVLPVYAPAIISGAVSCGCILGSHYISSRRTAALATCYELAQSNLIEYQNKVRRQWTTGYH